MARRQSTVHLAGIAGHRVDFVARLAEAFPGMVAGVRDREGNWAHTSALLARVPELAIVIGNE